MFFWQKWMVCGLELDAFWFSI